MSAHQATVIVTDPNPSRTAAKISWIAPFAAMNTPNPQRIIKMPERKPNTIMDPLIPICWRWCKRSVCNRPSWLPFDRRANPKRRCLLVGKLVIRLSVCSSPRRDNQLAFRDTPQQAAPRPVSTAGAASIEARGCMCDDVQCNPFTSRAISRRERISLGGRKPTVCAFCMVSVSVS